MNEDIRRASQRREPAINLPGPLLAILGLLIVLFVLDAYVLSDEMRAYFLFELAYTPLRYVFPLSGQGLEWLWTPVTYSFLHGSIEHLAFNGLWLAAFGAPVFRRIGFKRFMVFWALSAACSAFFHAALNWGQETILIGASGVISALMGAACRFAFPASGTGMFGRDVHLLPRQGIVGAMRNRTVLIFTILWFLGNVLIALGIPLVGGDDSAIAWDAHIGGFLFGYLLFSAFDPGVIERHDRA
ncbi:rhomboid family intramembrane serine protease [Rhizobium lemnae]|uniref:Rhomboid family intramembrane serine protease n=1 Tax=Rhizobium lemnae TaxID=1214924 RepID=A0ABV8E8B0_9HYPH|nr:rhomboid family intramembrane serine protease [Rhizobium lemnae]MCJ8506938.1 rhomboid family intramembrane serine protease [Rhizobium lemnae]